MGVTDNDWAVFGAKAERHVCWDYGAGVEVNKTPSKIWEGQWRSTTRESLQGGI